MLFFGQTARIEIDPARVVSMALEPGEMSLHHMAVVHGSLPNLSPIPRVGLVLRYVAAEVRQAKARDPATLVRGTDRFGHFDLEPRPVVDFGPAAIAAFRTAIGRPRLGLRLPPLVAGVVALSVGSGASVAEVIRSGLEAIPRGQHDAAALGLRPLTAFRLVILPQVVWIIVLSLTNEAIKTLEHTSLLWAITVVELTLYTQTLIAATFRPFEFYILAAAPYLAMTTLLESFARWYQRCYPLIL